VTNLTMSITLCFQHRFNHFQINLVSHHHPLVVISMWKHMMIFNLSNILWCRDWVVVFQLRITYVIISMPSVLFITLLFDSPLKIIGCMYWTQTIDWVL
jgi:hypothetical protein